MLCYQEIGRRKIVWHLRCGHSSISVFSQNLNGFIIYFLHKLQQYILLYLCIDLLTLFVSDMKAGETVN